eukprot:PhM_4_TR8363/c5_g3_i6/m.14643
MTSPHSTGATEHFRKLYAFGYHPTATRAALLLRISAYFSRSCGAPSTHTYALCDDITKELLSFCVDTTQVLVVDVADARSDFTSSDVPTCLVFDDGPTSTYVAETAWSRTRPPQHYIFASMCYRRAINWVTQCNNNHANVKKAGITVDMRDTHFDETRIEADFLNGFSGLISLDLSPLTNVTDFGCNFLKGCSGLTSLNLSGLANVSAIQRGFLRGCSGLIS